MKSRLYYFLISCFLGLLFILFTFIVKKDKFTAIDFDLTVKIQDRVPESLDSIFSNISFLASFEVLLFALIILIVLLFFKKKFLSPILIALFGLGHLVELYGKTIIDHPSPPMKFVREFDTTIFPQWYSHPVSSYPSGHALRVTFISILFLYLIFKMKSLPLKLIFTLVVTIFVCLTLFSRVSLGTHWVSDVIGGFLLGGNLGYLALVFL